MSERRAWKVTASREFARVLPHPALHAANLTYRRTHRGLPVYGGDFVVATDKSGQVVRPSPQPQSFKIPMATLRRAAMTASPEPVRAWPREPWAATKEPSTAHS
ncbi:hypothetical protein [Microtetraspora sp. NBRC 16547]|uniref:hypothetical protein n=1 Tax=Microtetraspora sp. NBRC 16547 TaxID=3030993 RepID=UPI00255797F3|nr:hypothetical protein [Microtetraspora sp. NBRC 16547]